MNPIREALIGKTITGVITRPGRDGLPEILMLALEDGSYMQFVMPQTRRQRNKASYRQSLNRAEQADVTTVLGQRSSPVESHELPLR